MSNINSDNQNKKLRKIIELGTSMNNIYVLDDLLHFITKEMAEIMEAERGTMYLLDHDKNELFAKISLGVDSKLLRLKLGQGIAGYVAETSETVNIKDCYSDPRFDKTFDKLTNFQTKNMLCIPLKNMKGMIIGVVQVINKKDNSFNDQDIEILKALSNIVATATENVSLVEKLNIMQDKLQKRISDINMLYKIESSIADIIDLQSVLEIIISECLKTLDAESGAILLMSETKDEFYFKVAMGPKGKEVLRERLSINKGIAGRAVKAEQSFYVNDVQNDPDFYSTISDKVSYEVINMVCIPLKLNKKIIGVLELLNKNKGRSPFTTMDVHLGVIIAGQAAKAIDRANIIEELVTAEKFSAIGALAGGIVHDMRNPMDIIKSLSSFLREETLEKEERESYYTFIEVEIGRFCRMTEDILDFARGETLQLDRKLISPKTFIENIITILENDPNFMEIECLPEISTESEILIDKDRMERVILNLAFNARDAMQHKGKLYIRVSQNSGQTEIQVQDTGPGIPPEIANKIFDPFCTTGKKGGAGLGLAISKKIVEDHGGTISIESKPGEGALFTIRIPN